MSGEYAMGGKEAHELVWDRNGGRRRYLGRCSYGCSVRTTIDAVREVHTVEQRPVCAVYYTK